MAKAKKIYLPAVKPVAELHKSVVQHVVRLDAAHVLEHERVTVVIPNTETEVFLIN
jgi:hypothetical protein